MPPKGRKKMQTLEDKLANAKKLVAKIEQEIKTAAIVNNVEVGDDVDFTFGRGDKKRSLKGEITAIKDTDTGKLVAIVTGEGFDLETFKVRVQEITENRTAATRPVADAANPLNAA